MFNAMYIKVLHRDRKINVEVHMEAQKTSNGQSNPEQKSNAGSIINPDFKLFNRAVKYKTKQNKNSMVLEKNRYEDQWNRRLRHKPTQLYFLDNGAQNMRWKTR
jgi:hypothetical protein